MHKFFIFIFLILVAISLYFWKSYNPKDKSENLTATPTEAKEKVSQFRVYFGNINNEAEKESCTPESSVSRDIPYTIALEKEALEELLKGPSKEERENGIYTNINEGVVLQSLIIEGGTAKADFSKELEEGAAGSCKVTFIASQIEKTLMQFENIKEVKISINGSADDILQP